MIIGKNICSFFRSPKTLTGNIAFPWMKHSFLFHLALFCATIFPQPPHETRPISPPSIKIPMQALAILFLIFTLNSCAHSPLLKNEKPLSNRQLLGNALQSEIHHAEIIPDSLQHWPVAVQADSLDPTAGFCQREIARKMMKKYPQTKISLVRPDGEHAVLKLDVIDLKLKYRPRSYWGIIPAAVWNRQLSGSITLDLFHPEGYFLSTQTISFFETDEIHGSHLSDLSEPDYPFTQVDYEKSDVLTKLEPFFVVSVISSITYLYYSTRNE